MKINKIKFHLLLILVGGWLNILQVNAQANPCLIKEENAYYIPLVYNENEENYSEYKLPQRKPWGEYDSTVKTVWKNIRFDPNTMMINTGDFSYSSSTGHVGHHDTFTVPYGTAFDCETPESQGGTARIDLRGTGYSVDDTFGFAGYIAAGSWTFSNDNQVVLLKGGGYCGWVAPSKAIARGEEDVHAGGWDIKLKGPKINEIPICPPRPEQNLQFLSDGN